LELMSPSVDHEQIKKFIARLVEAYADARELDLNGYGSWTVKEAPSERGLEPDECYVLGTHRPEMPDLAIEVIWSSWTIDKLEVYRGLGVREVWLWRDGSIEVLGLVDERYENQPRSQLLPGLDLEELARIVREEPNQTRAARDFRRSLESGSS